MKQKALVAPLNAKAPTALLSDEQRPGSPEKFSLKQIVQIVAVTCEQPESSRRSISYWTPKELAAEVVKPGIVQEISPPGLGLFLNEATLQPHRNRYWLNAQKDEPTQFKQQVDQVCQLCQLYKEAIQLQIPWSAYS